MAQETVDLLVYEPKIGVKYCPTCGIEYFDERAFCPVCGADIAAVSEIRKKDGEYVEYTPHRKQASEKEKEGSKLLLAIKIAGIAVAVLLATIVLAFVGFFL